MEIYYVRIVFVVLPPTYN